MSSDTPTPHVSARRFAGKLVRIAAALGFVATGMSPSACAPPMIFASAGVSLAEAGTSAFVEGELRAARKHPIGQVSDAFIGALESLQFPILLRTDSDGYVYIEAERLRGDDVVIRLRLASPVVTTIQIRVGMLGDQAIARLVMEEADRFLTASHLTAGPAEHRASDSATEATPAVSEQLR